MYENRKEHAISRMARVLRVSESGYYKWLKNKDIISPKQIEDAKVLNEVKEIHKNSKYSFGYRKITASLNINRDQSERINHKRVQRLMSENNIRSKLSRKHKVTTTDSRKSTNIAQNLLDRDFTSDRPGEKLVSDTTYVPSKQGIVYAAATLDLFGRMPVGLAMSVRNDTNLVEECFNGITTMFKTEDGCIHHSDRGSTYASNTFSKLIKDNNMQPSMSKKGDCYDNAVIESFFGKMKEEWIDTIPETIEDTKRLIYEYVWEFYPKQRPHQSLGYKTPYEYYNSYEKDE